MHLPLLRTHAGADAGSQLVTNHFLHFLTLDRSDPRKFQILQIIAALLNWSDGKLASRPPNPRKRTRGG